LPVAVVPLWQLAHGADANWLWFMRAPANVTVLRWQVSQGAVVGMCVVGFPSAFTPLWQAAQPVVIPVCLNGPPESLTALEVVGEVVIVGVATLDETGGAAAAFGGSFCAKFVTEFAVALGAVAVVGPALVAGLGFEAGGGAALVDAATEAGAGAVLRGAVTVGAKSVAVA
jgi:hypothetical protein